jgi:hypothetical protein
LVSNENRAAAEAFIRTPDRIARLLETCAKNSAKSESLTDRGGRE